MKRCLSSLSLGKCKFKKQNSTAHPLEWLQFKKLTISNVGKDRNGKSHTLDCKMVQSLWKSLGFS